MQTTKNLILPFVALLTMATLSLATTSCSSDNKTPEWEWPDDPDKETTEKPRFIWIDAAANFPDFANSKENITRDLTLAKNAGFTDIVVDVRPTTGDVLFRSTHCDQVKWLGAWLTGGYTKVERTATWDYLEAFITEGHKLGMKVHAGFNTFTGGNTTSLGSEGILFRDATKRAWATDMNLASGITSVMNDPDSNAKFFNPLLPEVQEYICNLLKDLATYTELDGIILDRARFGGYKSDFSAYTRQKFEAYIGTKLTAFPTDVMPAGHSKGIPSPMPTYFKKWLEFRAKTIHDFMEKARASVKSVNANVKFGVYVGGWYATYYDVGVNWASPKYNTSATYSWATPEYKNYGYADLMDHMFIGAYASPVNVYGTTEWTMQGFCSQAKNKIGTACNTVVGGPDVGNWDPENKYTQEQENSAIVSSVDACINACDGYFLFDMIHLKKADQWSYAKSGIDAYLSTITKK